MKKKLMGSLFSLSLILGLLAACGSKIEQTGTSSSSKETITEQTSDTSTASRDEILDLSQSQQIGDEQYGYVYVPKDWVAFHDLGGGESYQYSDLVGYNVVTLFSYSKEVLQVEAIDDKAVEQAANSYAYMMEEQGVFENVTGAMTEVVGYRAYQLYGLTKSDGKILCAWIFRTEKSDRVYLVSLEGDTETFEKVLPFIEGTWSETK